MRLCPLAKMARIVCWLRRASAGNMNTLFRGVMDLRSTAQHSTGESVQEPTHVLAAASQTSLPSVHMTTVDQSTQHLLCMQGACLSAQPKKGGWQRPAYLGDSTKAHPYLRAVLLVRSSAPQMTLISSSVRLPPRPSSAPWMSTSAFN